MLLSLIGRCGHHQNVCWIKGCWRTGTTNKLIIKGRTTSTEFSSYMVLLKALAQESLTLYGFVQREFSHSIIYLCKTVSISTLKKWSWHISLISRNRIDARIRKELLSRLSEILIFHLVGDPIDDEIMTPHVKGKWYLRKKCIRATSVSSRQLKYTCRRKLHSK